MCNNNVRYLFSAKHGQNGCRLSRRSAHGSLRTHAHTCTAAVVVKTWAAADNNRARGTRIGTHIIVRKRRRRNGLSAAAVSFSVREAV